MVNDPQAFQTGLTLNHSANGEYLRHAFTHTTIKCGGVCTYTATWAPKSNANEHLHATITGSGQQTCKAAAQDTYLGLQILKVEVPTYPRARLRPAQHAGLQAIPPL